MARMEEKKKIILIYYKLKWINLRRHNDERACWKTIDTENSIDGARHTVTEKMECRVEMKIRKKKKMKLGIAWIDRASENAKQRTKE